MLEKIKGKPLGLCSKYGQIFSKKIGGTEIRGNGKFVDEICHEVDGECVFHLEALDDDQYWIGLYDKEGNKTVNVYFLVKGVEPYIVVEDAN